MVNVDLDDEVYEKVKLAQEKNPLEFPNIRNFCNKVLIKEAERLIKNDKR